jgi:hypothetical protein
MRGHGGLPFCNVFTLDGAIGDASINASLIGRVIKAGRNPSTGADVPTNDGSRVRLHQ